jgi:Uma2 family endonuclease
MSGAARKLYDWDDYRSWPDDQRWEIIGGTAFSMTPAPTTRHQKILHELDRQLGNHFSGKTCQVFPAPTDVRLSDRDVVQPDLVVVCEPDKIKETHIDGAPTLVVEILSPSTATFDRSRKLALYARSGVKEVWLITPYPWLAEVFTLEGGSYRLAGAYERGEVFRSVTFSDLKIRTEEVFDYPIDSGERVDMIREGCPPYAEERAG